MTTTIRVRSVMLTVLILFVLLSHGVQCSESEVGPSAHTVVLDLPWQDELCCDSPSAHHHVDGGAPHSSEANRSDSNLPRDRRCSFRSFTTGTHPHNLSAGICLDVVCRIETWEILTCDLQPLGPPSGPTSVSLQRLLSGRDEKTSSRDPVVCTAEDFFTCSLSIDTTSSFSAVVNINISGAVAPPVVLQVQAQPVKPSPPVNLSHTQTIDAELILLWDDPSDFSSDILRYEVRYTSNTFHPVWKVLSSPAQPRLSLDLKPRLNYTVQVRCSALSSPPLWSDWSEPYHIYLDTVSYIPEKVVAKPGQNVTIYCVFNDHNINASMAVWVLNFRQQLHHSQYHPINQWVSQITVRPSETRFYDLLQCTQDWNIPYSQIFVEGASIDIKCKTSDDIDSMECSWNNTQWTNPTFRYSWADLDCDEMEERERAGEEVGELGPPCLPVKVKQKTCSIQPVRMNCYKLWLEVPSILGPVRSKPVYQSPRDHVQPHPPTDITAVSRSSRVLEVTWEPPPLPGGGLQCQVRYHLPSSSEVQPQWKVQSAVRASRAEVTVTDMCRVYVVEVRCMTISGRGYWSRWSEPVYSTPENSKAPDHGPNFWRILRDSPHRHQTNVTLLFELPQISGRSYCVEGFIVQRQTSNGSVIRDKINMKSSFSFEWDRSSQAVTVEAFNSRGSSANNYNMTLQQRTERRCVRSFSAVVINSTCVALTWTLLENSSVPLYMMVQWFPRGQPDSDHHREQSEGSWVRLPYMERTVYLTGASFDSEDCGFFLYPVFADGEGEPVYTAASRGDPAAYMMLMIVSFLSIVLFITLVLSQNQMKKFVWKEVPNPNKCSWAKGLDLKKVDAFDRVFRPPDGLTAWPLLLPSENISTVVIVEKVNLSALSLTPDSVSTSPSRCYSEVDHTMSMKSDPALGRTSSFVRHVDDLTSSSPGEQLQLPPGSSNSSARSSVVYSTVLLSDPKQDRPNFKDGSGSSSSDEGNFSANNSDLSGSVGGLLELDNPRCSSSYNSMEDFSGSSDQGDGEEARGEKDLCYLVMDYEDEEEQREGGAELERLKTKLCETLSTPSCSLTPLYMPQFRTAQSSRPPAAQAQESSSSTNPAVTPA